MTLQEAINHLQELLTEDKFDCEKCKKEHQQLLGWLLELENFRQKEGEER